MKVAIGQADALILVDIQNDFCIGSLAIKAACSIIDVANKYIRLFEKHNLPIFATRDWHPKNHSSFKDFGGIWPVHCVQDTFGSMFYGGLNLPKSTIVISKATKVEKDAYSGFDETSLDNHLKKIKIKRLFIGGLATDYCVKATILDALNLGYTTFFLSDASKAVEQQSQQNSVNEMLIAGAIVLNLNDLVEIE